MPAIHASKPASSAVFSRTEAKAPGRRPGREQHGKGKHRLQAERKDSTKAAVSAVADLAVSRAEADER